MIKKVFLISLLATLLFSMGVTYDVSAKEIAKTEVSKSEKSYSVTVGTDAAVFAVVSPGLFQDDVYYLEQHSYGNYILPKIEEVYIEVAYAPPITAKGFSYYLYNNESEGGMAINEIIWSKYAEEEWRKVNSINRKSENSNKRDKGVTPRKARDGILCPLSLTV